MHHYFENVAALSREKAREWLDHGRALGTVAADVGQYAVERLRDLRHPGRRTTDPLETIMTQLVLELSYGMIEAKKAVAMSIADEKRLARQCEQEQDNAEEWARRATLAEKEGDLGLTAEARARGKEHEALAEAIGAAWKRQQAGVDRLKQTLRELNGRIEQAKRDRNHLVARRQIARTHQVVQHELRQLDEVVRLLDRLSTLAEPTPADGGPGQEEPLH